MSWHEKNENWVINSISFVTARIFTITFHSERPRLHRCCFFLLHFCHSKWNSDNNKAIVRKIRVTIGHKWFIENRMVKSDCIAIVTLKTHSHNGRLPLHCYSRNVQHVTRLASSCTHWFYLWLWNTPVRWNAASIVHCRFVWLLNHSLPR